MLNRPLIIAIICLSPVIGIAQQRKELAQIGYIYIPVKLGDTSASAKVLDVEFTMPVFRKPKESLTLKMEFGKMTFHNFRDVVEETLYSVALQGAYSRKFSDTTKTFTLLGQIGIFSDWEDISGEDIRGTIGFQYKYARSPRLKYGLGLAYSNQFFGHQISPYVTFDYRPNKHWDIYGQFPTNMRAAYLITERDNVALGIRGLTRSYRLSNRQGSGHYENSGFIQTTQWSAKAYYEHTFGKHLTLSGSAGYAIINKFRQFDYIPGSMLNSWTIITFPVGKKRPDPNQEVSKAGMVYQLSLSYTLK